MCSGAREIPGNHEWSTEKAPDEAIGETEADDRGSGMGKHSFLGEVGSIRCHADTLPIIMGNSPNRKGRFPILKICGIFWGCLVFEKNRYNI